MQSDVGWEHWVSYGDVGNDLFTAPAPAPAMSAQQARRQRIGPPSLVELSLDAVARSAADAELTPAHLAQLPEKHIVALLARLLTWGGSRQRSPMLSLAAWKLLMPPCMAAAAAEAVDAAAPGAVPGVDQRLPLRGQIFVAQLRQPNSPLAVYLDALRPAPAPPPPATVATAFLAHLRIVTGGDRLNPVAFRTHELLALATLPNLAVLEILDHTPDGPDGQRRSSSALRIDDRLLRGWSTMPNAFPALSVLVLTRRNDELLTEATLEYVTRFPVLAIFMVSQRMALQMQAEAEMQSPTSWKMAAKAAAPRLGWYFCGMNYYKYAHCYQLQTTPPLERDMFRQTPFAYQMPRAHAAAAALPPPPVVRSWEEAAPLMKLPVLAAHWALRLNAFLVAEGGGLRTDVLKNREFALEAVDFHMAIDSAAAYQPLVSLTLGVDASQGPFNLATLFGREPGAAANVPETAFIVTGGANNAAGSGSGSESTVAASDAPPQLRKRKRPNVEDLIGTKR